MNANLTPGEWLEDQLARPDINLTQQQFGDAVGVGQSTVNGWIQGRARPQRHASTSSAAQLRTPARKLSAGLRVDHATIARVRPDLVARLLHAEQWAISELVVVGG